MKKKRINKPLTKKNKKESILIKPPDNTRDTKNDVINIKNKKVNVLVICRVFMHAIESKDKYTAGHSQRVSILSKVIAEKLEINELVESAEVAGLLHDVGKIAVEKSTLTNTTTHLTDFQLREINDHPYVGATIIAQSGMGSHISLAIMHHHERWDGNTLHPQYPGYPLGLKGNEIPILARIISVIDTFDALVSGRPYQEAKPMKEVVSIMKDESGRKFDPSMVDILLKNMDFIEKMELYK